MDIGNNVNVDGDVSASGRLRGGGQASQAGDAVLLGSDLRIPSQFYDSGSGSGGGGVRRLSYAEFLENSDPGPVRIEESTYPTINMVLDRSPCVSDYLENVINESGVLPILFPLKSCTFELAFDGRSLPSDFDEMCPDFEGTIAASPSEFIFYDLISCPGYYHGMSTLGEYFVLPLNSLPGNFLLCFRRSAAYSQMEVCALEMGGGSTGRPGNVRVIW